MRRRALPEKFLALPRQRWLIVLVALVVLAGGVWVGLSSGGGRSAPRACPPPAAPATAPPVSGPVSLAGWKLSVPVEGRDGDATTIQPAVATAPWMTQDPAGGWALRAPALGATTKHSQHPRTELDSLTNFAAGSGRHVLTASVTVSQEPRDGEGIIVGQIHGADDISSVPYVMARYQGARLYVVVKQVRDGNDHINYPLLNNLPLNSRFDFSITDLGNGCLVFSAAQGTNARQVSAPVPSAFTGRAVRFQAGDYQQSKEPSGPDDGGRVDFHQLQESNTPS